MKDLLVKFNLDVFFLRESKVSVVDHNLVKLVWSSRYVRWVALEAYGFSGDILLMWTEDSITVVYMASVVSAGALGGTLMW